ncbi:MAG: chemotaxis protein CheR [bacterium]|nr:chemotaxis protein CheR [bacterium]
MVNYVTTNLTRFNREKVQFQVLKNIVLPEIMKTGKKEKKEEKKKKLRIWSAGCSSGEEVYTILFEIMEFFGGTIPSFLDFKILGSDIDTNVLNKAKSGIYTRKEMKGLGRDVIERCFEPIFTDDSRSSDKEFVVKEKLRKYVLFSKINLVYDEFKFRNQLDIVFCRNVVIYFENEAKKKLYSKIYSLLNEPGFFFSGHSENLFKYPEMFEFLGKSVYKKVVFS